MWLAVQQCWSQGHWRRGRRFTHTLPLAPVPSVLCTGGSSSTESAILGWCSTGHVCVCAYSVMSTWDPMDCSPPGSSVHGISQARIMEWVAMPLSRVSSWPRGWTWVSCIFCISRRVLYHCATCKAHSNKVFTGKKKILITSGPEQFKSMLFEGLLPV